MANLLKVPAMSLEEASKKSADRRSNPNHIDNLIPVFCPSRKWNSDARAFEEVKDSSSGRIYFKDKDGNVPKNVILGIFRLGPSTITASGNYAESYTDIQKSGSSASLFLHEKYQSKSATDANHNVQIESFDSTGLETYRKLEDMFCEKLVEAAKNGKNNKLFKLDVDLHDRFTSTDKVKKYSKFQLVAKEKDGGQYILKSKSRVSRPNWGKKEAFGLPNRSGDDIPWQSDPSSFGKQLIDSERIPEAYPINAFIEEETTTEPEKKRRRKSNELSSDLVESDDDNSEEDGETSGQTSAKPKIKCIHVPTSGPPGDDQQTKYDRNNSFLASIGTQGCAYVDVTISNSIDRKDTTIFQTDISYCNIRWPKFKMTVVGMAPVSEDMDVESKQYQDDLMAACGF